MNQIVQDKMLRDIMVVPNEKLFANFERKTRFYSHLEHDFEDAILEHYEFMQRGIAEENTAYKQPIPYGVVVNEDNKVFVYKR
jgi:predicted NUDIX family phosphoesterase